MVFFHIDGRVSEDKKEKNCYCTMPINVTHGCNMLVIAWKNKHKQPQLLQIMSH